MGSEAEITKKPRFLCLHGFRTSGQIFKTQTGKWPQQVLEKLDLVFPDGPFPAQGKSDVEGFFDPPYYEWFQFNKVRFLKEIITNWVHFNDVKIAGVLGDYLYQEFTEYTNFEESLAYIEDFMIKHGPFDGLMGFSQGAILSAGLYGLQAKGVALTKVPKIKSIVIISGAKFKAASVAELAYASPIECPNLHFLGEADFLKPHGLDLLECCVDPVIIHHPKGHTIPRLDEKGLQTMLNFIERIQKSVLPQKEEK